MEQAKSRIDYARAHDFIHWLSKATGYDLESDWDSHPNPHLNNQTVLERAQRLAEKDASGDGYWAKSYEKEKSGITLVSCNSRTLYKLSEFGLIEIIHDSKGSSYGIDTVQVLNY